MQLMNGNATSAIDDYDILLCIVRSEISDLCIQCYHNCIHTITVVRADISDPYVIFIGRFKRILSYSSVY